MHIMRNGRHLPLPFIALLWPLIVLAVTVTSEQIASAVENSPNASAWLKENSQAVANLAINVESGGETTAYNGSCCYGVLQMNTTNIAEYAKVTPAEYQQWSLQEQIDAWSALTTDALNSSAVRTLTSMDTFDGREVDGNLVLACVQLGIGNCQKMINSGSCSGFADSNGTTICGMADKMASSSSSSPEASSGSPGSGVDGSSGTSSSLSSDCIRDGSGRCVAITEALRTGFKNGSGVDMSSLKGTIQAVAIACSLLVVMSIFLKLWQSYAAGRISMGMLKANLINGGLIICLISIALTAL